PRPSARATGLAPLPVPLAAGDSAGLAEDTDLAEGLAEGWGEDSEDGDEKPPPAVLAMLGSMPPSGNGEIPSTGDPRVDAALRHIRERNDAKFKDLENAMIVQAHLEKRLSEDAREHAQRLREHKDWLKDHQTVMEHHQGALQTHEDWLKDHQTALRAHEEWWQRHEIAMREFDDKLNALINIVDRMQHGER
ncbi:MAG: hypothetical protein ACRD4O_05420, partial [Bryobacteraceae bacterium]